jgi:transcriptional regulator with XRE-family HTH domain
MIVLDFIASLLESVAFVERKGGRMEEKGYTWFGEVLYRILTERGSSQSALAREARERGLDYRQNSVSNWMRGVHAAPRELPTLVEELYDLSTQEWIDLGLAFAYGQRVRRRDLEAPHDLRTRYKHSFIEQEGLSFAAKTIED